MCSRFLVTSLWIQNISSAAQMAKAKDVPHRNQWFSYRGAAFASRYDHVESWAR